MTSNVAGAPGGVGTARAVKIRLAGEGGVELHTERPGKAGLAIVDCGVALPAGCMVSSFPSVGSIFGWGSVCAERAKSSRRLEERRAGDVRPRATIARDDEARRPRTLRVRAYESHWPLAAGERGAREWPSSESLSVLRW